MTCWPRKTPCSPSWWNWVTLQRNGSGWGGLAAAPVGVAAVDMGHLRRPVYRLRLAEDQIDHPTAADVRPVDPAVGQDVRAVAPGLFEGVGQDRHRAEVPGLVHLPGEADGGRSEPAGVE